MITLARGAAQWQALALAVACSSCDYRQFSTRVGDHVVYHWDVDAWAAEGEQLCGGTVQVADSFLESIAAYYEWPLGADGPIVEYFWDHELVRTMCTRPACTRPAGFPLGGVVVFTNEPFDSHELAHTAKGGHGHPDFINEAFASRWASGAIGGLGTFQTQADFPTEAELRVQFGLPATGDLSYQSAVTWWFALESEYGPAKMTEFVAELEPWTSPDGIDRALQRVFGISLAESVVLAENLPEQYIEDPACKFQGLPTFAWNDEPLVIDRSDAGCEDGDIISIEAQRATWLAALEFPKTTTTVDIDITVPEGEDPLQKMLILTRCDGDVGDYRWPSDIFSVGASITGHVHGRYVAGLQGVIRADGSVELPRVVIVAQP